MLNKTLHAHLSPSLKQSAAQNPPRRAIPAAPDNGPITAVAHGISVQQLEPPFLTLLVLAALIDWLVTRTFTRFAVFIPKSPALITGYEATSWLGLTGSALAAILALAGLAWVVRQEWRLRRFAWLGLLFVVLGGLSITFLVVPPGAWALLYNGVMLAALTAVVGRGVTHPLCSANRCATAKCSANRCALPMSNAVRAAILFPALAMFTAGLYQSVPGLYAAMQWPGPPLWSSRLYQVGEILVVGGSVALWWAYGRPASAKIWAWTALPALFFTAIFLAESALTATIVVWSNGLTLFLPWWFYAAAIWLVGVTLINTWTAGRGTVAGAILLLCAAGYAPQLSSQFFFGLIALWLLLTEQESEPRSTKVHADNAHLSSRCAADGVNTKAANAHVVA